MSQHPIIISTLNVASTASSLAVSYADQIEQWLRIAAVASAVLVNVTIWIRQRRERREKK